MHQALHTGHKSLQCPECPAKFTLKSVLNNHIRGVHKKERPFACEVCGRKFSTSSNRGTHLRRHLNEFGFKCDVCQRRFVSLLQLKSHSKVHKKCDGMQWCSKCSTRFPSVLFFERHYLKKHVGIDANVLHCIFCKKVNPGRQTLEHHIFSHIREQPYFCKVCPESFSSSGGLQHHFLTHVIEKPHKCHLCSKAFRVLECLKDHVKRRHNKSTASFWCIECSLGFPKPGLYERHYLEVHVGYKGDPFECIFCKKKLKNRFRLESHICNHLNERPFTCKVCPKSFQYKISLIDHFKRHQN